ncbi:hypothetical protein EC968_006836 [Mortierella alpina]|nr:hypothetical protein EC968_006836 [Mortierella alpina]
MLILNPSYSWLLQVYFKPVQKNEFTASEDQLDPVSIKSNGKFEVLLDTGNIHPGWYWAVFCVSLEGLKNIQDKLDSIIFDVTREKMIKGVVYKLDYTCKTVIGKDEIHHLLVAGTKFARLKLHRQIEVKSGADLTISIKVETGPGCDEDVSFDLQYFELACFDTCSEDHVLWGEGKPDQYIRIGDEDAESQKKPITIGASDISSNGKLAVTVYFNPTIIDPRTPGGNFAARLNRASDPACTSVADRNSDRAYTIDAIERCSASTSEKDSVYDLDQSSTHGMDHTASHIPHQYYTQVCVPAPTPSHVHSHTSDRVGMPEKGHSHAPTSTSTLGVAHIDVWDVTPANGKGLPDYLRAITKSLVTLTVPLLALKEFSADFHARKPSDDPPQSPRPTINISSTGLHIIMAVGWATTAVHATPFLIFRRSSDGSEGQSSHSYRKVSEICQSLQNYFGYGAFHNMDPDNPNPENERYYNFHGFTFDVYSTSGSWKQLYSLTFGINRNLNRPEDMYYLTQSLRGRYFAWTGDTGVVSIWDFETGKYVTTILVLKDKKAVCAALCEDNSMIAITVNGCIQVHDVASGIKLGVHKAEWKENHGFEIIFRHDYLMALNAAESTTGNKNIDARSIFQVHDMKVIKTHILFWQYAAEYSLTLNPVFSYQQGALLNIKRLGNILCPNEDNDCTPDTQCQLKNTPLNLKGKKWLYHDQPRTRPKFVVGPAHSTSRILSITRLTITIGPITTFLSLGPRNMKYFGFFMPASSQLVLILNGILQVWRLPSAGGQQYELVHVEAVVADSEKHANDICIIKPSKEVKDDEENDEAEDYLEKEMVKGESKMRDAQDDFDEEDDPNGELPQTFNFPRAASETRLASVRCQFEKGVASLLDTYADSDLSIKHAIIRFFVSRIRPSPKYSSSLVILCRSWKFGYREIFEEVITNLLPSDKITWIPDINATKNENPLWILTKIAKKSPSVLGVCKVIMDYCVHHAVDSKNLSFLSPFLRSLKRIMTLFPDEARVFLRRIAYIPVSDRWRDYIVENSIVTQPPWGSIQLRKTPLRLDKIKKPILQLHVTAEGPRDTAKRMRSMADTFNRPIYVASFDALWHFKDADEREGRDSEELAVNPVSMVQPCSPNMRNSFVKCWLAIMVGLKVKQESKTAPGLTIEQESMTAQEPTQATTWWRAIYHIFRLKCYLRLTLMNTIGYGYWAFRFSFHCVYYGLVIAAALLQIYHENVGRSQLAGVFVAIISVGSAFLWLELLQAIKNFKRYRRAFYNLFDIVAYTLPMTAAVIMLAAFREDSVKANTRVLSWSVLIVLLHMVFELRVYKSVGQYETFIRESVHQMKAFFLIFAGGLVAFTIAILHLLRACAVPGSCEDSKSEFSKHFFAAFSAMYFFMGGRFDPVAKELMSEDWTFHIMMIFYFFFTVIIMLNMLIALINVAFANRDDGLSLMEARLHYIEMAENLSYHIPGFRQTHNWFPKEIYFSATARDIQEYEEMVKASEGEAKSSLENDPALHDLKAHIRHLESRLSSQQEQAEQQFQELKPLLLDRAVKNEIIH